MGKKIRTRLLAVALAALFLPSLADAQGVNVLPRNIIDFPIAYCLPRASFDVNMRFFPHGGVLATLDVGMTDRLMVGLSFGGINIIGEGDVEWNPFAGAAGRFELVQESFTLPALAIGFDSQGQGVYVDSTKRFERKSPGFFAVMSKNYSILNHLSFHTGVNYSLEGSDKDRDPNLFVGGDLGFSPEVSILAEYDFALNDNSNKALGSGNGYLNVGVRYNIKNIVNFEFYLLDLFENRNTHFQRALKLTYFEFF